MYHFDDEDDIIDQFDFYRVRCEIYMYMQNMESRGIHEEYNDLMNKIKLLDLRQNSYM